MALDKPATQLFATVTEMRAVPEDKIDAFCEDLRLWLHMHKRVEAANAEMATQGVEFRITTPTDAFGWVDDGRHDANINVTINGWLEVPPAADAVDPSAGSTGKSSTRVEK